MLQIELLTLSPRMTPFSPAIVLLTPTIFPNSVHVNSIILVLKTKIWRVTLRSLGAKLPENPIGSAVRIYQNLSISYYLQLLPLCPAIVISHLDCYDRLPTGLS